MKVETVIGTLQAALVLDVQRSGLVPNVERSADSLVRVRQFARPTRNTSYFAPGHKHKKRGQGCPRSVPALPFCSHFSPRHSPLDTAFSLIEILITVGLLSFIILGLLLMFNQVQRAFRSSTTQADILEAGRAVADMLARELEEMTPSHIAYKPGKLRSINFMTEIESPAYGHYDFGDPLRQFLPGATMPDGSGPTRTNIVQEFFFMRKLNQDYVGTGYLVVPHYSNAVTDVSVGSLYRYAVSTNKNAALSLGWNFVNGPNFTDLHRVADGVTHLRLRAFDTSGVLITPDTAGLPNVIRRWQDDVSQYSADQVRYYFYSNAVPAYLELEIAFLEPHLLDRYKALEESDFSAGLTTLPHARSYLSNHVANVHLFRRRIPIHNVDFAAYQ